MENSELHIGVVGSGVMGRGLVQLTSMSSFVKRVYWKSGYSADIYQAKNSLESFFGKLVEKEKLTKDQATKALEKIVPCTEYKCFSECKVIHEVVSENIETKLKLLREIDRVLNEGTIIASNTSSLSITELALNVSHPSNVIGMHFFNPAPLMNLVEIISGISTSLDAKNFILSYAVMLGKTSVEVEESPGFIVNRILIPMINEAICILADKVADRDSIDIAMKLGANHPIGPLALADLIGNDIVLSIMEVLYKETGDQKYRPNPLLRKMVRAGKLGKKTLSGFYQYG